MYTRKGLVDRAVTFKGVSTVPFWVTGGRLKNSDVFTYDLSLTKTDDPGTSEWGFVIERGKDGLLTIPTEPALTSWNMVDDYQPPQLEPVRRLAGIGKAVRVCEDRYRLATLSLSGFAVYRALRGRDRGTDDALIETDRFLDLFDSIIEQETKMFDMLVRKGFHGIELRDDWNIKWMTLSLWRKLLKPRYALQIRSARELGLHVWFSNLTSCEDFYGDLIELGINVLRIDSPYAADISTTGRQYAGKAAFAVCLDDLVENGTVSPDRYQQIRECLSYERNGFIGHFTEATPSKVADKAITALRKIS
ncbi:MAG: hypothetical protein ACOX6D_00580 [Thermoguttaceae bacterium]|jgi:hypothetical protein